MSNGEKMYVQKRVHELVCEQIYNGNIRVSAKVTDKEEVEYHVNVDLTQDGEVLQHECSCSQSYYWGLCSHTVAVLFEYMNMQQKGLLKQKTSLIIKNMIYDYTIMDKNEVLYQRAENSMELVPRFHFENTELEVDFKVGNENKYVIKDLNSFVNAVIQNYSVSYGKKLEFVHSREVFSETAMPFLDFIIENVSNYSYLQKTSFGKSRTLRYLPLSGVGVDKLFEILMNQKAELFLDGRKGETYQVVSEEPYVKVLIRKAAKGAEVSIEELDFFKGCDYIYVIKDHKILRSGREYKKNMEFVLELFETGDTEKLFISEEDLPSFCAVVLPKVSQYAEVDAEGIQLEEYMPEQSELKIYLDMPEKNRITCKIISEYGEKSYNILESFDPVENYRDIKMEYEAGLTAKQYFDSVLEKEGCFVLMAEEEKLFQLLEYGVPKLQKLGQVFVSDPFKTLRIISSPKVSVGVAVASDLLELTIDTGDLPLDQILSVLDSYKRRKKFHRLKNGEFIRLDEGSFSTVSELADGLGLTGQDFAKKTLLLQKNRAIYLDKVLREGGEEVSYERDTYFKQLVRTMKSVEDSDFEIPEELSEVLREYQKTGYRWMKTLASYQFGGILADDMGLGKTVQVIAVLLSLRQEKKQEKKEPCLIVCPASLVYNWESELEKFAPSLKRSVVAGTAAMRRQELLNSGGSDVVITSYDLLKRDMDCYKELHFAMQFIDEAQYIKNQTTQVSKAVKAVKASVKFALTGTPIENRLSELWSIFDYLMPGLLYTYRKFREDLEAPIVQEQDEISLKRLQRMIRPFILRRLKKEVLKELPDKLEEVVYSKMEGEQLKLYTANVRNLKDSLENQSEEEFKTGKLEILAELTKLRQLCCDPSLCYENYKGESAKLLVCMELIENAVNGGHKILLFSQFTSMLERIEEKLCSLGISYYTLTGKTVKSKRRQLVEQFNKDDTSLFLISLKAGGTGLNLTAADIVIHYDPWWNLAAQNQATDRAHRIGQKNIVTVYKLIAKHSIEEKILRLQETKRGLADQIVGAEGIGASGLKKEELLEILAV